MATVNPSSVRSYLRSLSRRRNTGVVTSDDAHRFMTKMGLSETATRARATILNEIFPNRNAKGFQRVGTTPSARPEARRRRISTWMSV